MAKTAKKKTSPKKPVKRKAKNRKGIRTFFMFAVLVVIAISAWYFYQPFKTKTDKISFLESIPKGFESFGIDLSHHQGTVDWDHLFKKEKYDTIIDFVYCKATEGSTHTDTRWETNRKTLNELGICNGAYHFLSSKKLPRPQVAHFLQQWQRKESDLPPVLDVETEGYSDEDLRAKMVIWLDEVEKQTGMRPIIYTSLNFFETKFKNYFPGHKFWIAAYSQKPSCIYDKRIVHWQYSEDGILPGIDEEVDLNVSKIDF